MAKQQSGGALETVKTIVYAGLIAVGIRTIAFEPFNIPSPSMVPTLLVGDYLFVSKYSYGYSRFSLPFAPNLFHGRIFGRVPTRGDVVVFYPPNKPDTYIKRVIGLPGDRVKVTNGQFFVNGNQLPRKLEQDDYRYTWGTPVIAQRWAETLPNGRVHDILKMTSEGRANNTEEFVVPEGNVFMMGDNRDDSADSRFSDAQGGVGYVPLENLVGRAEFLFFSIDAQAPWWQFWEWPFEIRWSRLLHGIS